MNLKNLISIVFCCIPFYIFSQTIYVNENFNSSTLPTGWTTTSVTGSQTWSFGFDGSSFEAGNNNLNGTSMAYFEDYSLGSSSRNNTSDLSSPPFNNSQATSTFLDFDYNFAEFASRSEYFRVEVFDGTNWQTVLNITVNDCGSFTNCTSFPHATIDISAYKNSNCKVKFTYHDGNQRSLYVSLDNVVISSTPAEDVGVTQILSPTSDCGIASNSNITVLVNNFATTASQNIPIKYDINNGTFTASEVIPNIAANSSTIYTFNTPINIGVNQSYSISVFSDLLNDYTPTNDTITKQVNSMLSFVPDYFTDFDSGNNHWISSNSNSWSLGSPSSQVLNTAYSGFNVYYTKQSGYLNSPCFSFSADTLDPYIEFKLNYFTLNEESLNLRVQYSIDQGQIWNDINASSNSISWQFLSCGSIDCWKGDSKGWITARTELQGLAGQDQVWFRFVANTSNFDNNDIIAIDNIRIYSKSSSDLALNSIVNPIAVGDNCGLSASEDIIIEIENKGLNTINNFNLSYSINNSTPVVETVNMSLPPDSIVSYVFMNKANLATLGNYNLSVWISNPSDLNSNNDSILNQNIQVISNLPYKETFDSFYPKKSQLNTDDNGRLKNGWKLNDAFVSAWVPVDYLTSGNQYAPGNDRLGYGKYISYVDNGADSATIESPCVDLRQATNPYLKFWYYNFSYTNVYLDVFDGTNWQPFDTINNTGISQRISYPDPYALYYTNLSQYTGLAIKVRFRIDNKGFSTAKFSFDDFEIADQIPLDAELMDLRLESCYLDSTVQMYATIRNNGSSVISSNQIQVSYNDGSGVVSEFVHLSITAGDSIEYNFTTSPSVVAGDSILVDSWVTLVSDNNSFNDSIFNHKLSTKLKPKIFDFEDKINVFNNNIFNNQNNFPRFNISKNGWILENTLNTVWDTERVSSIAGPSVDHTIGTSAGKLLFLRSSDTLNNISAISPCMDFTNLNTAVLRFWTHRFGSYLDTIFVDISDGTNWFLAVDSIYENPQLASNSQWTQNNVNLTDARFIGKRIRIRFRNRKDIRSTTPSYIGIDDIEVLNTLEADPALIAYENPLNRQCFTSKTPIDIKFKNLGFKPIDFSIDSVRILVNVNGPTSTQFTYWINDNSLNGGLPLSYEEEIIINIDSLNMNTLGSYFISSSITFLNDGNYTNNNLSEVFEVKQQNAGFPIITNRPILGNILCYGDTTNLPLLNSFGDVQWQKKIGNQWVDILNEVDTFININVLNDTYYRAVVCGNLISDSIKIGANPTTANISGDSVIVSNCADTAKFKLYNQSIPNLSYSWYNNMASTVPISTQDTLELARTFNASTSLRDSVFVEIIDGKPLETLGSNIASSGSVQIPNNPDAFFQVKKKTRIISFEMKGYVPHNLFYGIRDSISQNVIFYDSVFVNGNNVNGSTIYLNLDIDIGSYELFTDLSKSTMSWYSITVNHSFPIYSTDSSIVQISNPNSPNAVRGYYNWQIGGRCVSDRTPVYLYADCLVGIEDENSNTEIAFEIFPNPTNDGNVSIKTNYKDVFSLDIFDLQGKAVLNEVNLSGNSNNLDLRNLANGVYLVQVLFNNRIENLKIIIQ